MSQRHTASGRRPTLVWLAVVLVLVLAIALAVVVFIIGPQQQLRQQAQATAEARQAEAERLYTAGVAFQNAGDCGRAVESLAQVISLEPNYKDAQTRLAEARACQQATEATATARTHATEISPPTSPATPVPGRMPTPTSRTGRTDILPTGDVVSAQSLARVIGGDAAYWTPQDGGVWRYWNKGVMSTFRHPGGNITLTYWAGFPEPRNADGCSIGETVHEGGRTRTVQCTKAGAEFEADGVGFHPAP